MANSLGLEELDRRELLYKVCSYVLLLYYCPKLWEGWATTNRVNPVISCFACSKLFFVSSFVYKSGCWFSRMSCFAFCHVGTNYSLQLDVV